MFVYVQLGLCSFQYFNSYHYKLTLETSRLFNFLCELKLYCESYLPKLVVAIHPRESSQSDSKYNAILNPDKKLLHEIYMFCHRNQNCRRVVHFK